MKVGEVKDKRYFCFFCKKYELSLFRDYERNFKRPPNCMSDSQRYSFYDKRGSLGENDKGLIKPCEKSLNYSKF